MSKSRRDYNKYWRTPVSQQYKQARKLLSKPSVLSYSTKRRTLAYYKASRKETHIKVEKMIMDGYGMKKILENLRGK